MSPFSPPVPLSCLLLPILLIIVLFCRCSGLLLTKTTLRHGTPSLLHFPPLGDQEGRSPILLGPVRPFAICIRKYELDHTFHGDRQLLESGFPARNCQEGHAHGCTICPASLQVSPGEEGSQWVRGLLPALLNPKPDPTVSFRTFLQSLRGSLLPPPATRWPLDTWIHCPHSG